MYLKLKGVGATYSQSTPALVGAKWYYDWGLNPPVYPGIEAVPMIWGASSAGKPVGGNSPWVMWWNEANGASQANLTPTAAAELWNKNIGAYPGKLHVAPSATQTSWLKEFLPLVDRKPDALSIHPYMWKGNDFGLFAAQLGGWSSFARAYGIGQLWITEFGLVTDDPLAQQKFMRDAIPVIASFELVTRYAWFQQSYRGNESWAFSNCANMSLEDYTSHKLTALGKIYRGNKACDLNNDGQIDILDMVRIAQEFGQSTTW